MVTAHFSLMNQTPTIRIAHKPQHVEQAYTKPEATTRQPRFRVRGSQNLKGKGKGLPKYRPVANDDGVESGWTSRMKQLLKANLSVDQANAALREATRQDRQSVWRIFQKACRSCWVAGRGLKDHRLSECVSWETHVCWTASSAALARATGSRIAETSSSSDGLRLAELREQAHLMA